MNIITAKHIAQEKCYNGLKFLLVGPSKEKLNCKWVDAYLGVFEIIGKPIFFNVRDFKSSDIDIIIPNEESNK